MSERDPRYKPIEFLLNAPDDGSLTDTEQNALCEFKVLAEIWQQERTRLNNLQTFGSIESSLLKEETEKCEANVLRLVNKLSEMTRSPVLSPIVDREYQKVIDEDAKRSREKYIQKQMREQQEIYDRWQATRTESIKQHQNIQSIPSQTINQPPTTVKEKPSIFKAIMSALLGLIIFGLVYIMSYIIVSLIIYVLSLIPLIGGFVDWLFYVRGDSPDLMLSILSPTVAYFVTMFSLESINKSCPTFGLSCVILGICLLVLHIASIVLNLLAGEDILKNIVQAIAGVLIFIAGREALTSSTTSV